MHISFINTSESVQQKPVTNEGDIISLLRHQSNNPANNISLVYNRNTVNDNNV